MTSSPYPRRTEQSFAPRTLIYDGDGPYFTPQQRHSSRMDSSYYHDSARNSPLATPPAFNEYHPYQQQPQVPIRNKSGRNTLFREGEDSDPYTRYEGTLSQPVSTYSLGGQSQLRLNPKSPTGSSGMYDTDEDYELDHVQKKEWESSAVPPVLGGRTTTTKRNEENVAGKKRPRGRKFFILLGLAVLLGIAAAAAIPAVILNRSGKNNKMNVASSSDSSVVGTSSTANGSPTISPTPNPTPTPTPTSSVATGIPTGANGSSNWTTAPYGGDGSIIYTADGSTFTYNNSFGGFWVSIPFNDTARAQNDVPPLNEPWDYSKNLIQGVNLGGWITIEPFITPSLFEPFNSDVNDSPNATDTVIDEWTLSQALGTNLSTVITNHYETFITEKDFAEIAGAGLNWVRLPIPWWIIEVWEGEPFLAGVGWNYFLKAIVWARKYGLRINLDLHAVPGSQNGYNHSGKQGSINLLNGVMGFANAQRTLDYIRTLTEFISQPQYSNVVPMFSILNEPLGGVDSIQVDALRHFYLETYSMIRNITSFGTNNGPFIALHDAFLSLNTTDNGGWLGWLPGSDRVALDRHPYLCFSTQNNDGLSYQAAKPCSYWAAEQNITSNGFGLAIAGEWSLAINDCGQWLNNVGNGNRYEGTYVIPNTNGTKGNFTAVGNCDAWNDYTTWNQTIKDGLKLVAQGHMDALRHWFFWTWKTGYSQTLQKIANPMWNYQLGLQNGYIPLNPRDSLGSCQSLVKDYGFTVAMPNVPSPPLASWMTGKGGAGVQLNETMYRNYSQWPPTTMGAYAGTIPYLVENLPRYTATKSIITMPVLEPTTYPLGYSAASASVGPGSGWYNANDRMKFVDEIPGCVYPDPWAGAGVVPPLSACTGPAGTRLSTTTTPMNTRNTRTTTRRAKRGLTEQTHLPSARKE